MSEDLVKKVRQLLSEIYKGLKDKSGVAYFSHPYSVMLSLPVDASDDVQIAALLHDVTLCGSTRFQECFEHCQKKMTLAGYIVISVGLFGHREEGFDMSGDTKKMLDRMHFRKIEMADTIYVLNKDGYIGLSTWDKILYAISLGKNVIFMEPVRDKCADALAELCEFERPSKWLICQGDTKGSLKVLYHVRGTNSSEARIKEFENVEVEKSFAFVDSKCPKCNGSGLVQIAPNCRGVKQCNYCRGTGLVGEYKEVPDIPLHPDDLSRELRKTRERRLITMHELASMWKTTPSRISELETGTGEPRTAKEEKKIREWINGNNI